MIYRERQPPCDQQGWTRKKSVQISSTLKDIRNDFMLLNRFEPFSKDGKGCRGGQNQFQQACSPNEISSRKITPPPTFLFPTLRFSHQFFPTPCHLLIPPYRTTRRSCNRIECQNEPSPGKKGRSRTRGRMSPNKILIARGGWMKGESAVSSHPRPSYL
ncbi:hypothetical protein CEXT_442601 [Caerostris extrusa]|uniref:Uncharacterized protein n=1 Tax=Caerostris extrusa TaxID=172846 RepID=A0AAV4PEK9_CAEEX|nr:hypothetical protein CEXT_442601 [Caerostris extrusa]